MERVDENLRAAGDAILYEYDGLGRLILTDYPDMEDVIYEYGAAGAGNNAAGRLVSRSDESGSIRYEYGLMGDLFFRWIFLIWSMFL